jgi:SNF2 family DNA or RNA helicase
VLTQLPERTDNTVFVELSDEQRGPYEDQRAALAALLRKNYLTDLDRKRILACIVNMRTICDSTFLFDRQTRVSPKLDEFAELVPEITGEGDHKAVVFSQWETMVFEAAKVLDTLGVGYAVLHGGLPGKDRKEVLEKFKSDPACKVFLSTDAGGTGLNLQVADTVLNLELPWNPAVLEQRIARVHRMGQSRPVRVINLVTRGTIEERVLRTLEAKQGLFSGIFEGGEDEIPFEAVNAAGFLDTVRELIGEQPSTRLQPAEGPAPPPAASRPAVSVPHTDVPVWHAVAHLLEGVSMLLGTEAGRSPVPDDVRDRLRTAVSILSATLGRTEPLAPPGSG